MAKPLAASALGAAAVPNNIGDCMIALDMAQRFHATRFKSCKPLRSTGRPPGLARSFLIATINACGRYAAACAMNGRASPATTTTAAAWAEERPPASALMACGSHGPGQGRRLVEEERQQVADHGRSDVLLPDCHRSGSAPVRPSCPWACPRRKNCKTLSTWPQMAPTRSPARRSMRVPSMHQNH